MGLLEELETLGVNVGEGLQRLNGNRAFYERMLGKFTDNIQKYYVDTDFDNSDYTEITEKAHTIKGTAGNLSITPVYEAYTEIVNELRAGRPDAAKERIEKVLPVQNAIIACIEKYKQA